MSGEDVTMLIGRCVESIRNRGTAMPGFVAEYVNQFRAERVTLFRQRPHCCTESLADRSHWLLGQRRLDHDVGNALSSFANRRLGVHFDLLLELQINQFRVFWKLLKNGHPWPSYLLFSIG